jgi:hypothetical protein
VFALNSAALVTVKVKNVGVISASFTATLGNCSYPASPVPAQSLSMQANQEKDVIFEVRHRTGSMQNWRLHALARTALLSSSNEHFCTQMSHLLCKFTGPCATKADCTAQGASSIDSKTGIFHIPGPTAQRMPNVRAHAAVHGIRQQGT